MDYFVKDFIEENYKKNLKYAKNRYDFVFYNEVISYKDKKIILWRHDIDVSVHRAYVLAKIEKEIDIKSTFFLLLGSGFYNIFEKDIKELVRQIISLGHKIGLHFDPTLYDINNINDLEKYLKFEKEILENLFDIDIKTFSFHNPTEEILKYDNFKYANMVNTYAKYFKENVMYCSDSNGYWRYDRLEEFLKKDYDKIQVLTHPVWWQKKPMTPRERIQRSIDGRKKRQEYLYDSFLDKNNRLNIK